MAATPTAADIARWRRRPVLAALVRVLALVGPVGAGILGGTLLGRRLPTPTGLLSFLLSFAGVTAVSMTIAWVVDKGARRLLPLAALLNLSLLFPDHAPSRYKTALRAGSVRSLERQVEAARSVGIGGSAVEAAEKIIELAAALNAHDRLTRGHAERVRAYADLLAAELRLDREDRERLHWAALLHDVGKIFVHPHILNKDGKPTEHEWEVLRSHPEEGGKLAAPLAGWLGPWSLAIAEHHEAFDGSGYPRALAGSEISYGARIVAVADAYDVMTSNRSYKKPMPASAARAELTRCAGAQFDPVIVRAFLNIGLGRLRWAMGPLSSVFQLPLLGRFESLAPQLGWVARAAAGVAAVASGGLLALDAPATPPSELAAVASAPDYTPLPSSLVDRVDAGAATPAAADPVAEPPVEATPTEPDGDPADLPGPAPAPSSPPTDPPAPIPTPAAITRAPDPPEVPVRDLAVETHQDEAVAVLVLRLLGPDAVELDPASLELAATATAGTVTFDGGAGVFTYRPDPGFVGTDRFRYRACTPGPAPRCAEATVQVVVVDVIHAPEAAADSVVLDEDDPPVVLAVLDNDRDADGDLVPATLQVIAEPMLGRVAAAPGRLVYTPEPDRNGVDEVGYRICDTTDRCADAKVRLTIRAVNDAPAFALPARLEVAEDSPPTLLEAVTAASPGPPDEHGQQLTFTVEVDAAPALLVAPPTIDAAGRIGLEPRPDANGQTTLRVVATDDEGDAVAAATTLVVTPVDDTPVAVDDAVTAVEDVPVTIAVLANDLDPDADGLTVISATGPTVIHPDGTVTYTATPDANGTHRFTYTVRDPSGRTDTATVTIDIVPANDAPAPAPDTATTAEDRPVTIDVLLNDTDVDGDALTITASTGPTAISRRDQIRFTPPPDANGTATFTYTVSDGLLTSTATVTVTITPVDDPPTFTAGPTVTADAGAGSQTLAGWSAPPTAGPPDEAGQALTITLTPDDPALFDAAGPPTLDAAGTLRFTPAGQPGTTLVSVVVSDGGGPPATGTFAIQLFVTQEHVLISEFAHSSPASAEDEFVELFNPSAAPIDVSGYVLAITKNDGNLDSLTTIPAGTVLPAGAHYLFGGADFTGPVDQRLAGKIESAPGFQLRDGSGAVLDGVGTAASTFHEGRPVLGLTDLAAESYERREGGVYGSCVDTDDNATDFVHHQAAGSVVPQHLGSPPTPCTALPPVPPTTASGLVVSEFRAEGPGGNRDEFVELFNAGPTPVSLAGWRVAFAAGSNVATAYTFDSGSVPPGGHVLLAGEDWDGDGTGVVPDGRYGSSGGLLGGLLGLLGLGEDTDLAVDGTVLVMRPDGSLADAVGLGEGQPGGEGERLLPLARGTDTYERRAGDDLGSCVDTGNNATDFRHRLAGPGYQNLVATPTPCAPP